MIGGNIAIRYESIFASSSEEGWVVWRQVLGATRALGSLQGLDDACIAEGGARIGSIARGHARACWSPFAGEGP